MRGRAFLDIARELIRGGTEAHRRATVVQAYYAFFLECRDALTRWRIAILPRQNVHSAVRLRFMYAGDANLKQLGYALDTWCRYRNDASYNLAVLKDFSSDRIARDAIAGAVSALSLLDALESDPVRRAVAIASFPP
jgi:hypothetical protein